MRTHVLRLSVLVPALLLAAVFPTSAQDVEPPTFWKSIQEKTIYEHIWEQLRLYENESNDVVQAVSLIGRYHGQFSSVNADQGHADGWENRRFFLGAEAELFHQLTLQVQVRVSEDFHPFYDGLYQAFVEWYPSDAFTLSAGRVDYLFTGLERSISSTRIVTFERGLLVNQLMPGEVVGIVAESKVGDFSFRGSLFSGSVGEEFTQFKGGFGATGGVGYNLTLFYETGGVHLDYLFNNGNSGNNALEPYDHIVSLWHQGNIGPFGLGVDLTWGHGLDSRPAVFGLTVLPSYVFAKNVIRKGDALQVALRYQFAVSDRDNGLELQQRYEQDVVPSGFGDHYHAVYAGLNYLIFGDRFKIMTGAEYSVMHDAANDRGEFNGWTYFAGVRVYF